MVDWDFLNSDADVGSDVSDDDFSMWKDLGVSPDSIVDSAVKARYLAFLAGNGYKDKLSG